MDKPFDRLSKDLAEDDPRALLHLMGELPINADASVVAESPELGFSPLEVDHLFRIRHQEREWLSHYEVQTRWRASMPQRMGRYGALLALKHNLPVESTLVMLVERFAPRDIPDRTELNLGSVRCSHHYRVVRFWELDAAALLSLDRPRLLPWVALMNTTPEAAREALSRLQKLQDRDLAFRFRVLAGLRYPNKEGLDVLIERLNKMLTKEMLKDSWAYMEVLEEGVAEGLEQGRGLGLAAGRDEEARRLLARMLAVRFPELPVRPLEQLDAARIETLFDRCVLAPTAEDVRTILASAGIVD